MSAILGKKYKTLLKKTVIKCRKDDIIGKD